MILVGLGTQGQERDKERLLWEGTGRGAGGKGQAPAPGGTTSTLPFDLLQVPESFSLCSQA